MPTKDQLKGMVSRAILNQVDVERFKESLVRQILSSLNELSEKIFQEILSIDPSLKKNVNSLLKIIDDLIEQEFTSLEKELKSQFRELIESEREEEKLQILPIIPFKETKKEIP